MAQKPRKSMVEQLEDVSASLDRLISDMRSGQPSQAKHDVFVDRARAIAQSVDASTRRHVALARPPLFLEQRADGSTRAGW